MIKHELILKQTEIKTSQIKRSATIPVPTKGWINAVRQALGMTTTQLAKRMSVSQARIVRLEQDECNKAVTLKSLQKAANAMECEIIYAIVPKESLRKTLENQAAKIAKQRIRRVQHSMVLEGQGLTKAALKKQYERLLDELLQTPPKKLWDEE